MSKYRIGLGVRFFRDTDRQVTAVVMETAQLVLTPLKNFQRSRLRKIIIIILLVYHHYCTNLYSYL